MSFKSKDLAYNARQPAFLARIRNQHTGPDPDRHEISVARPRGRNRTVDDEDEDAPTYVLDEEDGNTLSKEEYNAMLEEVKAGGEREKTDVDSKAENTLDQGLQQEITNDGTTKRQDVTEAGFAKKKRKAAKVVGVQVANSEDAAENHDESEQKPIKKAKTRVKPIKLSFGD